MNGTAQTAAIALAIIGSYAWLSMGSLSYYSPQLAGVLALAYFGIRFFRKKHLLPLSVANSTPEFALVSASTLLLIGSTGNLHSFFFPLAFLHIFFLTMSIKPAQALLLSFGMILFHYSLAPSLTWEAVSQLSSILLLMFIFLFAKSQYEEHVSKELIVEKQQVELSVQQSNAILFVTTFLKPKLDTLLHLSEYPEANKQVIERQITIIQEAVEELLMQVEETEEEV